MVTKEMSLQNFLDKADEVINGKYLFASKKIGEMLKTVSSSKILFEVFEYCCREDYSVLRQMYFYEGEGGKGGYIRPEDPKHTVAIGFYALKEIADGDTDFFNNFLLTYFPASDNLIGSYMLFINSMVVPFRNTVKNMVESVMVAKTIREKKEPVATTAKDALDAQYLIGLMSLIEDDLRILNASSKRDKVLVKDMICVLEAFFTQAACGNVSMFAPLFIGYKYCAAKLRKPKLHIGEIEEMLIDHGILK